MSISWILVMGMIICVWAMLNTLGAERQRRLRALSEKMRQEALSATSDQTP